MIVLSFYKLVDREVDECRIILKYNDRNMGNFGNDKNDGTYRNKAKAQ